MVFFSTGPEKLTNTDELRIANMPCTKHRQTNLVLTLSKGNQERHTPTCSFSAPLS
jgi:hypothetical protein